MGALRSATNRELGKIAELQMRLAEAEDTLNAIRSGSVDALVVRTPHGEQLFTLKGADQTYRALVEAMNEGAVTLRKGIISYCNNRFAEMLSTPLEKVLGTPVFQVIAASDFPALIRRLQKGPAARASMEAELNAAGGRRVPVLLAASRFYSEGEASVCLVVTDISGRKQVEEALRASEERFQTVARTTNDAIWDWDIAKRGVWRSGSLPVLFGYPPGSVDNSLGWWSQRIHPDDREEVLASLRKAIEGPGNLHASIYRFRRHDGSYAYVSDRGWILRGASGQPFRMIGALRDVTAEREAELARRELSRRILNAQEHERQRVARDLHDSVNQLLSSAKYRLSSLAARDPFQSGEEVRQAHDLIEKAMNEVRLISRNLRPSELDDLGLVAALRSLTHDFRVRSGIAARFADQSCAGLAAVPKEVGMTLYRIAQEALNNVEKHSGAARVDVKLHCTRASIRLTVRDNGRGFYDRCTGNGKSGWGLQNMTERAALLGGTFKVNSHAGGGTRVSVQIPFLPAAESKPADAK